MHWRLLFFHSIRAIASIHLYLMDKNKTTIQPWRWVPDDRQPTRVEDLLRFGAPDRGSPHPRDGRPLIRRRFRRSASRREPFNEATGDEKKIQPSTSSRPVDRPHQRSSSAESERSRRTSRSSSNVAAPRS